MKSSSEHVSFNFTMGLLHGVLYQAGLAFSSPTSVLPVFLNHFTTSLVLIGLFSAIVTAGGVLPQLIVAHQLQGRSRSKPVLVAAIWTRAAAWGLLSAFTWLCADCGPSLLLSALFVCLLIFSIAGGIANVPFSELWGRTIPVRLRGRFWGHRQLWGGLLAIGSGYVVKRVLGADISFPRNYALLFGLSFVFFSFSYIALSSAREPAGDRNCSRGPFKRFLFETVSLVHRDSGFRWLILAQVCTMFFQFALPFYVLYGIDQLDMPSEQVGILVVAQTVGALLSNLLWGWVSDRIGNRSLIRLTAAATIAIPALALAGQYGRWEMLLGVFVLIGAAISGTRIGFLNYVLEIAPPASRPSYIALSGTLNGLLALLPVLGGWIADVTSYRLVFAIALGFAVLALVFAMRLPCLRGGKDDDGDLTLAAGTQQQTE